MTAVLDGHHDAGDPTARPDPGTTSTLVQACADRRRVRLGYRCEAGSEWVADVDPWALVVRHGRWYLLCHSHAADARHLDPVALLEEHLAVGWEYDVEVVIDAALDAVAPRIPRSLGRLEPVDAVTTRLVGSTSNPTWYAARRIERRLLAATESPDS